MRYIIFIFSLLFSTLSFANDFSNVSDAYANLVYKNYQDSLAEALALQKAVDKFVTQPDTKNLEAVKKIWITARKPYLRTEAYRFYGGPIDNKNGPEERINAWPLNEGYIDYIVNQDTTPITAAFLKEKNQQKDEKDVTTGWHAIEYLVWRGDYKVERRRQYLKQATDLLVDDLRGLVIAWEPGKNNYAAEFKKMNEQEAISKMLTGIASLSGAEMALERMNNALISGERLDNQSCFSDTTHQDFVYNAKGVRDVYMIVSPVVTQKDADLDKKIRTRLDETDRLIAVIPNPYGGVLATPKENPEKQTVKAAIKSLQEQAVLLQKAGKTLGVTVDVVVK